MRPSFALRGAAGDAESHGPPSRPACRDCRFWQSMDRRWGRCRCPHMSRLVDAELPLVTRDGFACVLHLASAVQAPRGAA